MREHAWVREDGAHVDLHGHWLRVVFSSEPGDHADFHYRWLRTNCDLDRDPVTARRVVPLDRLPEAPRTLAARVSGWPASLQITWAGEIPRRTSVYPIGWLREHAYAYGGRCPASTSLDLRAAIIPVEGITPEYAVGRAVAVTRKHGLAIVRGFGHDQGTLWRALNEAGLRILATHLGPPKPALHSATVDVGAIGFQPRTDAPHLRTPPRFQGVLVDHAARSGVDFSVVDGRRVARHLRETDRQAHEALSRLPVRFNADRHTFGRSVERPVIDHENPDGPVIRHDFFRMAPVVAPFDLMENWFRAYAQFSRLLESPSNHATIRLAPGDFALRDNHALLHNLRADQSTPDLISRHFGNAESTAPAAWSTG